MKNIQRKILYLFIFIIILIINGSLTEGTFGTINKNLNEKTALILNPSEYLYGNFHCTIIARNLKQIGYTVVYIENEEVDLEFIKTNLDVEIIYINTHAGYWDTDDNHIPDSVVIATGEHWTNETNTKYSFEINNNMVVKGLVGDNEFVCFTPLFIKYYYGNDTLPNSLIYMATCEAAYDDSMAKSFLSAGAGAYMGWSGSTVFWTNSITSSQAFRFFKRGKSVDQVCNRIRYGGFYNFLFRSKMTYYGNGDLTII